MRSEKSRGALRCEFSLFALLSFVSRWNYRLCWSHKLDAKRGSVHSLSVTDCNSLCNFAFMKQLWHGSLLRKLPSSCQYDAAFQLLTSDLCLAHPSLKIWSRLYLRTACCLHDNSVSTWERHRDVYVSKWLATPTNFVIFDLSVKGSGHVKSSL